MTIVAGVVAFGGLTGAAALYAGGSETLALVGAKLLKNSERSDLKPRKKHHNATNASNAQFANTCKKVARYALLGVAGAAAIAFTVTVPVLSGVTACILAEGLAGAALTTTVSNGILWGTTALTAAGSLYGHYKAFSWALKG